MSRAGKKKAAIPPSNPEPKAWWEEYCRWKPRGAADQYGGGRYETIHEYNPLE